MEEGDPAQPGQPSQPGGYGQPDGRPQPGGYGQPDGPSQPGGSSQPGGHAPPDNPAPPDTGPPPNEPGPGFPPPPQQGQRFLAPGQRPPTTPREPRKPPPKDAQQRGWSALALGLLSLIGLSAVQDFGQAFYVLVLTLLIGAAGIWAGASATSRARRGKTYLPRGAISGIILGGFGLTLSVIMLAGFALLSTELTDYSNCMKGANTVTAQQSCKNQLTQAVHNKINNIQPSAGP